MGNGIHKKKKKRGGNCISHLRKSNTFVKKADVKLHSWPADPIRTIPTTRYMITSRELLWSGRLILLSCSWPSWMLAAEEEDDDDVISRFTIMSDQRKPNCFCWRHRQRVEGRSRTPICYGPALARGVKWRIYYHPPAKGGCALTSDGNLSVILWDEGDQRFVCFMCPLGEMPIKACNVLDMWERIIFDAVTRDVALVMHLLPQTRPWNRTQIGGRPK